MSNSGSGGLHQAGEKGGFKHDQGKAPFDLIPWPALEEVALVMGFGAKKYGVENWRLGMRWGRCAAAAFRHLSAWMCGQDKDPETGYSHLAHAACCIMFLLTYERYGVGEDDRPKWEVRYKQVQDLKTVQDVKGVLTEKAGRDRLDP